ncbi:zf-HC2 domain-containing protein [Myxococcus sp. K38C18041901]|uniref:zf-HC2 domain-containing protein n=1 Tax=Myxococcus guangdongensis TaxID=2906760 RepID=UPI0020A77545|nr:zf-HC2 domain-containing protein [Myxococcus guangdongensis]MCP3060482.1 zf-HC2 domain-containing protein [Myxococcus guangdongensis]
MAACPDMEARLDLHAAGALEPEETVPLLQHVESCAGCREALAQSMEVLSMVALPAPTAAEKAARDTVPQRALETWKRERMSQTLRRRTVGSLLAAAAVVALMVLMPGMPRPWATKDSAAEPTDTRAEERAVEAQTLADFEAWAGLEPLEPGATWEDEESFEDLEGWDDDLLGETL